MTESKPFLDPDWTNVQRVLVIMAHPDDPDFTCAGTATLLARQGIEVTYMILTNGDKGNHNPEITRNQLIALRKIEQRNAAEVCGVQSVLFMGEEDGFLRPTKRIRERVTREIRRIRPQLIISTDPDRYLVGDGYINHPDHRNAGLIALEAIFPAADNPMFYPEMADEGYLPHKISQLYVFGHSDSTTRIDITDVLETKIAAILRHKTQISDPENAPQRWRERWGETQADGSVRYYERFKAMRLG
ncbi:MAG: PIG-L deacetylase family protein [Caldilineaceae bacterium]